MVAKGDGKSHPYLEIQILMVLTPPQLNGVGPIGGCRYVPTPIFNSSFNWTAVSDSAYTSITWSMLQNIYKVFSLEKQEVRKCLKADLMPLRLFYNTTAGDSARKLIC